MKNKILLFSFLTIHLAVILAGCGENNDDITEVEEDENNETEVEETIENETESEEDDVIAIDRGLMNVEITLPASFVGTEEEADAIVSEAKEEGFEDITKNDDGSLTYKMSRGKHNEMMDEIALEIEKSMEEIAIDEDVESIEEVTANEDYSEITIRANQVIYENSFDGFATIALGMSGLLYQVFEGVSPEKYQVTITLEDTETGEVFGTIDYPDVLEQMDDIAIEE